MSGTKEGALKAKVTNLAKYGPNYYQRIAAMTKGVARPGAGFAAMDAEKHKQVSAIGGRKSRRKYSQES